MSFFVPFVIILLAITGLLRLSEYLTADREPPPRRDFIPDLPASFDYERLKSFAGAVSYTALVLDQDLMQWALDYAEKIPDHKDCFPEIKRAIIDFCSNNPGFISEFQYTIVSLRVYNCLRLRSLGAEEIDFDIVEKHYKNYIFQMTKTEWHFYHESYNLVRGLCANERQFKSMKNVKDTVAFLSNSLDHYVNYTKKTRHHVHHVAKNTLSRYQKKLNAEKKSMKRNGKLLQATTQNYTTKLRKLAATMNSAVEEGNIYTKTLENTVKGFARNLKKIGPELNSENNFDSLWVEFVLDYGIQSNEMEKKIEGMGYEIGQLYKVNKEYNKRISKNNKARKRLKLFKIFRTYLPCFLIIFCTGPIFSYLESWF